MTTSQRSMRILLIEDNPTDADIIAEALREALPRPDVLVIEDGQPALDHLRDCVRGEGGACPDLIVLDLNLPGLSGRDVLEATKADPALQAIPVIVLSSSTDPRDIWHCYDHHANCYVVKPVDLDGFLEAVRRIAHFWADCAELPVAR